jgi:hypothetical protein
VDERILDQRLDKVAGWLFVYIFICFIAALSFFWLKTHSTAVYWLGVIYAVVSLATAISLMLRLRYALILVATQIGLRYVSLFYVLFLDVRIHHLAHPANEITQFAVAIALNTIWFLYFRTSRRVRNVFGRNL